MTQKKKSSNHYNKNNYHSRNYNQNKNQNFEKKRKVEDTISREIPKDFSSKDLTKEKPRKVKRHPIVNFFLFLTLLSSLAYFGITLWNGQNSSNFFGSLVSSLLLVVFSILFIAICVTSPSRKKGTIFLGSFFLLLFNLFGGLTTLGIIHVPAIGQVADFTGKSLTDVVRWAEKNNVTLNQDYEYSDMVPEYSVISQNIDAGKKIKDVNELTVSISEGPNPDKEIIVPDMDGWDSDRVIQYVEDNYLNNVEVEFEESDRAQYTVMDQSKSGTMRRSDELKLTFSLGEEVSDDDVKMVDLTDMSEFEATFWLKQHRIKYETKKVFSKKIERGNVANQSVKAGAMAKVNTDDKKVVLSISKGKSIKVPNLKKMSMVEITNWIVENKLKLELSYEYDDSVDENEVIDVNYDKGKKIEQGTTIKITISKGSLVMKDFDSFDEFREWANKYNIPYEEKHEFSEDVPQGEVISYSYKKGETIKNGDSIIVTISDGKERNVPDLIGMTKKEAIEALEKVGLNYNFVTQNSNKSKNTVIKQSISAGSKVSDGTTITVTISNGKKVEACEENDKKTNNSSSSNHNSGNSNNTSKPEVAPEPEPDPVPEKPSCDKSKGAALNIQAGNTGSQTKSMISQLNPNHKFSFNFVSSCPNGDTTSGSVCDAVDGQWRNFCDTITITIVT